MEKKRSLKYLIISACLALLIASIGGMVIGATDNVEADGNLIIKGASLDLNDKISIAFAVEASVAGYDAETGEVANYVHIYSTNPDGTAAAGDTLNDYVVKNIGGADYVLFITDGYAPTAYGTTIYARLIDEANGAYGKVQKTGVLELVSNLNNNLKESDSRYAIKKGLYDSILAYGDAAYEVVEGVESPYNFVAVEEGTYNDGANGEWATGVVADGTKITIKAAADTVPNLASLGGGKLAGLQVNGQLVSGDSVVVNEDSNISIGYTLDRDYQNNPYLNSSSNSTTFAANFGATINDLVYAYGPNGSSFYSQRDSNKYSRWINFSKAADGSTQIDLTDVSKLAGSGGGVYNNMLWFENLANAGSSLTMSFDVMFPSVDYNENNVYNEAWTVIPGEEYEDEETGEIIKTEDTIVTGDLFTQQSTNWRMFYFYVALSNKGPGYVNDYSSTDNQSTNNVGNAQTAFYVHTNAVYDANGIVKGFNLRTNAGGDSGDANGVDIKNITYGFDEWHHFDLKLITDSTGLVNGYQLYVNYNLVDQRLNSTQLTEKNLNVTSLANATLGFTELNRYQGDMSLKNITCTADNYYSAAEIVAMEGYDADYVAYDPVNVYSYQKNASSLTEIGYRWGELATLPGISEFGNYYRRGGYTDATIPNGSWIYDEWADTVYVNDFTTAGSAGRFNVMLDNPFYQKQSKYVEGQAIVIEFDMVMLANDSDGDGIWNEKLDNQGGQNSVVNSWIDFGYSNSSNTTPDKGKFAHIRVDTADRQWYLRYNSKDNGDVYLSKGVTVGIGQAIHVKMVAKPNATTGAIEQIDFYTNGTLVCTRYNVNDQATGFSYWSEDKSQGAYDSIFTKSKIGFCYDTSRDKTVGGVAFRNITIGVGTALDAE